MSQKPINVWQKCIIIVNYWEISVNKRIVFQFM